MVILGNTTVILPSIFPTHFTPTNITKFDIKLEFMFEQNRPKVVKLPIEKMTLFKLTVPKNKAE